MMRRWKEKLRLARGHKPSDAPHHPAVASSEQPAQQPALTQIHLPPLFAQSAATTSAVRKSQEKLQRAIEELESVLQALTDQPSSRLPGLQDCLTQSVSSPLSFQDITTTLQEGQEASNQAKSKAYSFIQKLQPLSQLALGLTGTVASYAGYAPVQIATNGVARVLELVVKVPEQSQEVVKGLESIAADEHLLAELKKLTPHMVDEIVLLGLIDLQTQLTEFLRTSLLWLNKPFFAKFANCLIEPTGMADARSKLASARETLSGALSSDNYLTVKWRQIAVAQAEMLNQLCPDADHTTQLMKQKELHNASLENSGAWALTDDKFVRWRDGSGGILWCPGVPGAGKTYMVSRIVDHLELTFRHQDVGLAYVYCEFNRVSRQSKKSILEVITRQLIARKPELCFEFQQQLQDFLSTEDERKALLKQVLSRFGASFLILDALDEFSPEYTERHSISRLLRSVVEDANGDHVRLCITCRQSEGIWEALYSSHVPTERLEIRSSEQDIRSLVERTYDKTAPAISWMEGNQALRELAVVKVLERSDCIFKLADLQIQSVLRKPSAKAMKQALEHLTTDVNHYYREAMGRIAGQKESHLVVFNLLRWLAFSRSPIHMHELELALSLRPGELLEEDMEDQIVDMPRYVGLSEGLVVTRNLDTETSSWLLDDENHYDQAASKGPQVLLAHHSIGEYLRTDLTWLGRDADALLLDACLTSMTSPVFINHILWIWRELCFRKEFPYHATPSDKMRVPYRESWIRVPEFIFWALATWGEYLPAEIPPELETMMRELHQVSAIETKRWRENRSSILGLPPWEGIYGGPAWDDYSPPHTAELPSPPAWSVQSPKHYSPSRHSLQSMTAASLTRNLSQQRSRSRSASSSRSANRSEISYLRTGFHRRYSDFLEPFLCTRAPFAGPLYWCAYNGWTQGCKVFLAMEQDPNVLFEVEVDKKISREYRETAFSAAVAFGDAATVKVFLDDERVDPDIGKLDYVFGHLTPLMTACKRGDQEIVRMLLARDEVDVNAYDNGGYGVGLTPLLHARTGITALLLERADLDVNMLRLGRRPIHHLANIGGAPNELEMLLRHPKTQVNARIASIRIAQKYIDHRDTECFAFGRTALMVAALVAHPVQTKTLLDHPDIDTRMRDDRGMTALMLVAMGYTRANDDDMDFRIPKEKSIELQHSKQQHVPTLRLLLHAPDAQTAARDNKGRTALSLAVMCGIDPTSLSEYTNEVDFDDTDDMAYQSWYMHLSRAARGSKKHHVDIVRELLHTAEVDVNAADASGHTPLDYVTCSRDFVVQERDWEVQVLKKTIENQRARSEAEPVDTVADVYNSMNEVLEAMGNIRDLLLAAGAQGGVLIEVPVIPENSIERAWILRRSS